MIRAYYGPVVAPTPLHWRSLDDRNRGGPRPPEPVVIGRRTLCTTILLLGALPGCIYRASLSQGNLLKQEDLDQVEVGMTRNQVRFLLGTPMVDDPFHANRWDYVYYLRVGRKKATFKRWVSIYFENEVVSRIVDGQELRPDL